MYSNELSKLAEKLKLEETVTECFHRNFIDYMNEYPEEVEDIIGNYDSNKLETWIHSVSIKCNNWPELDYCNLVTELKIIYDDDEVGVYYYYCDFEGSITDTILRFH